jgi:general secretion pathway protein D
LTLLVTLDIYRTLFSLSLTIQSDGVTHLRGQSGQAEWIFESKGSRINSMTEPVLNRNGAAFGVVNRDVKGGSVVRAKTLAVVAGLTVCTMSLAMAGPGRFVHHTLVVLGFDDTQSTPTAQELLRKGIDDYRWGRYDDANRAFSQASKMTGLSDREQEILAQYRALLVRVTKSRQEASELLTAADRAYEQGDYKQAESLATTVAANGNASLEDRDAAKAILAKLQSGGAPATRTASDSSQRHEAQQCLAQARQALRQENLDEAESLAHKADNFKLTYGRLEDTPSKVLQDVADARALKAKASSGAAATASNPKAKAKALVTEANSCLKRNEFDRAEQLARQAKDLNTKFYLYENSPDDVLLAVQRARRQRSTTAAKSAEATESEKPGSFPPPLHQAGREDAISIRNASSESLASSDQAAPSDDSAQEAPASYEFEPVASNDQSKVDTSEVVDARKEALKLLRQGRIYLREGNLNKAEEMAQQAADLNASYRLLDDTPRQLSSEIARANDQRKSGEESTGAAQTVAPEVAEVPAQRPSGSSRDLSRQAQLHLKKAHDLMDRGDCDSAIEIAHRVQGWGLTYGFWDDTPAKVESAAKALKSRNVARSGSSRSKSEIVQAGHTSGAQDAVFTEPPAEAVQWLSGAKSTPLNVPGRMPTASRVAQSDSGDVTIAEHASGAVTSDEQKLEMARELFDHGNYTRARERALEVASSNPTLKPEADELVGRITVAEQSSMYQLYEAGVAAARKNQYTRALNFFQQVYASGVELDPTTDQQLRAYLRDLPGRVGTASRADTGMVTVADGNVQVPSPSDSQDTGDIGQRERAKFQQLVTETNHKVQAAKLLLQSNPPQAIRDLEAAQQAVRSSGLDASMTEPLARRLETAIRFASQEKQRSEVERVQDLSRGAAEATRKRQLAVDEHKRQEVYELVEKGNAAFNEARYEDAELAAKKALEIDRDNLAATALRYKARIEHQLTIQKDLQELKESRVLDTYRAVDESAIPFGNDNVTSVRYPEAKIWEDLTQQRKRRFEGIEKGIRSPKELEIDRKLSEPITINFKETPLSDVVAFLHEATNVNVVLDKHSLNIDSISSDKPVSMDLVSIPLRSALRLILGQMDLDYMIRDDVLLITTPLRKQGDMSAKSYFVGDLVVPISAFPGTNVGGPNPRNPGATIGVGPGTPGNNVLPGGMPMPNAALAQIGTGIGGTPPLTMGGNVLPGYSNNSGLVGTPPGGMGTGQIVDFDSLIQLVEQTISPNSWSSVGGAGTIQPFQPNLSLVVNQTQAVHEQISDLLTQLRRLQDLQVTVEVKFVTLTEDFFERIGIDFDMDIQSDAQKPLRSFGRVVAPATFPTGGGGNNQTATPPVLNLFYNDHDDDVTVGVNNFRGPNGLGNTGSPVFTPDLKIPFRTGGFDKGRPQGFVQGDGLSFGIAFLSDIEVFLFLEAAQQNNRGNVLTAPKVTLFNGQFAFVFSGSIEPFVTALNPVVAAGAVAFDPQIQQFFNGAFLGVQAVISADRRYVRLSLFPSFNNISGEKRFTVTGGAGGFGGIGGGGGGGGAAQAQAEIVVPIISTNFVFTTVSVPDGGTVMMGGLKTKREFRNEFGTPILNKIPYVQRLFMNTGVSSSTQSLLLMVTPRIIIQEEEEELLGKTIAL